MEAVRGWVWIFSGIAHHALKACRDESVVIFVPSNIYITLYVNVSSTLLRKNRNTDFLYIYIYIYFLFHVCM